MKFATYAFSKTTLAACAALTFLLSVGVNLRAQDVLEETYGTGVHAYFDGRFQDACDTLTTVIDTKTKDPRAYYFRAMAHWKLGQQKEATADMARGAAMEEADINQMYPVSKSLERVQGAPRLALEKYRAQARVASYERRQRSENTRYQSRTRAEGEVLRVQPGATGITQPVAKPPTPKTAAPEDNSNPFATPAAKPPAAKPVAPAADDDDPFAEPTKPAADAKKPADKKPADAKPDDTKSDDDKDGDDAKPDDAKPDDDKSDDDKSDDAKPADKPKSAVVEPRQGGKAAAQPAVAAVQPGDDKNDPFQDDPEE